MKTITYLIKKQFKNYLISLKRNPAKLIGYLFIVAMLVFVIVISLVDKGDGPRKSRAIAELGGIIMGLFLFLFMSSLYTGLERGATFFKMSDVNLLFTTPLSSKKVLLYGIIKQMGLSFLLSFFMIYQMPTLIRIYGINWGDSVIIFVGYMMLLIASNICSMAIYMFVNGNATRKKLVKTILSTLLIMIAGVFTFKMLQGMSFGISIRETLEIATFIPVVGWIKGAIYSIIAKEILLGMIYSILSVLIIGGVILFVLKSNADYYEDVLTATEYIEKVTQNMKQGKAVIDSGSKLKGDKLKNFGLRKGKGAAVIFYKQILENRRSGLAGIGVLGLIQVTMALGGTYFLSQADDISHALVFLIVIGFMAYMQILFTGASRWASELQYHYIYLIPQSGFKKMLYSSLEGILKAGIDGVLMFVPAGIYLTVNPVFIILAVLTRMSFEILAIGINLLSQKVFGTLGNKGMMMMLYFLAIILFALPGIIGGVVIGIMTFGSLGITNSYMMALAVIIAWNVVFVLGIMLFSNQIFMQMELNTKA